MSAGTEILEGQQAEALVEEARALVSAGKPIKALKRFRRAFELAPFGAELRRHWFQAACVADVESAILDAGMALISLEGEATPEAVAAVAKVMLKYPPEPEVLGWFDRLADPVAPPEAFEAIAVLHAWRGDEASARRWFRRHCLSAAFDHRAAPDEGYDRLLDYIDALREGPPLEGPDDGLLGSLVADAGRTELTSATRALWRGEPLSVLLAPSQAKRLRPNHLLRRLARADRGVLFDARVRHPALASPGWVHPIYCGLVKRLHPRARERYGEVFLLDLVRPEVLEAVRRGEGCLVFDHGHEGLFVRRKDEIDLAAFLLHLQQVQLPAERVIILDGNRLSPERVAALAQRIGAPGPKVLSAWGLWLEASGVLRRRRQAGAGGDEALQEQERLLQAGGLRPKHFLSFNHAPRPHRCALLADLLHHGLLNRGLVSFAGSEYLRSRNLQPVDEAEWIAGAAAEVAGLVDVPEPAALVGRLAAMAPMSVDAALHGTGGAAKVLSQTAHDVWPYLDSYVSVVTDTVFSDGSTSFVTEKLCRSIANLHPFVYLGEPGVLSELRVRGYRTFGELIDERYDDVADPRLRMSAALAEVRRLASMPLKELDALYRRAWPILVHNHQRFWEDEPLEADRLVSALQAHLADLGR